jgi:hypothetical protein
MRFFTRFGPLAISIAVFLACESEGTPPPTAELFADPEVCDVPCEVVLDSGLEPAEGKVLTFTWDVGDGPAPGDARLLHTFETAGAHTVFVTASDGQSSTTDKTTVQVEAQPKAAGVIDAAGGSVSQDACTVTVPDGVTPQAFTLEVTKLPSMQEAAERVFRTERFTALGDACDVSMPLKSSTPVDVAVRDPEVEGLDPDELAWLVRAVAKPLPPSDQPELVFSPAPFADYVLLPVTKVDSDGTAHGDIYGRKRVQLVRLVAPLDLESQSPEAAILSKAVPTPLVLMNFMDAPTQITKQAYIDAISASVAEAHKVLVTEKKFMGPRGAVLVVVGKPKKAGLDGSVYIYDHDTIYLSHALPSANRIKKTVAHEYFHLIQNICSNKISNALNKKKDEWFKEGTAAWAMDEVFDQIPDSYYATQWYRFEDPLTKKASDADREVTYRTVGFWKWAEATNSDVIRRILEDRYVTTHMTVPGAPDLVENLEVTDYLSSLKKLWDKADFLEFTYQLRYAKEFDTEEDQNDGELWWTDPYCGEPKYVYVTDARSGEIEAGVVGDSEDNPLVIPFELKPHLTANALRIASPNLEGALRVRFPHTPNAPLEAYVLIHNDETYNLEKKSRIPDLRDGPTDDVSADFNSDKMAVILIVDPRWQYDTGGKPFKGEIEAWIEDPCGPIPQGAIQVSTTQALIDAVKSPGAIIQLAPGIYDPPIGSWEAPEYGPFMANLLMRNVTLIGAGQGATTIELPGGDLAALYTYNNGTLRNLTVDALPGSQVAALDHRSLTLCDVTFNFSSTHSYGVILNPWHGGSTAVALYNTTLSHPVGGTQGTGLWLQTCSSPDPVNINATIQDSEITGWYEGVLYDTGYGSCGSISLNTDCEGFANNNWNVLESNCPGEGEPCTANEKCP